MPNLCEIFETFLEIRRAELAAGTVEIYRLAMGRLVRAVGDVDPRQILPMDAMRFFAGLSGELAAATANMYLRSIKCFFHWMETAEIVERSAFAKVKPIRDRAKGQKNFTADEIDRLLCAAVDVRVRLLVLLAATTGMRRGEILNLTVGEIDYCGGLIRLVPKQESAATWEWELKDHESRTVPITADAERLLLQVHSALPDGQPYILLKRERYEALQAKRRRLAGKGLLLPSRDAKCPISNFRRTWEGLCVRADVEYRAFRALRGSALSCMAGNGLHPHEVQRIAGHSDVRTTYSHYVRSDEHLDNARNAAFSPQNGRYRI